MTQYNVLCSISLRSPFVLKFSQTNPTEYINKWERQSSTLAKLVLHFILFRKSQNYRIFLSFSGFSYIFLFSFCFHYFILSLLFVGLQWATKLSRRIICASTSHLTNLSAFLSSVALSRVTPNSLQWIYSELSLRWESFRSCSYLLAIYIHFGRFSILFFFFLFHVFVFLFFQWSQCLSCSCYAIWLKSESNLWLDTSERSSPSFILLVLFFFFSFLLSSICWTQMKHEEM